MCFECVCMWEFWDEILLRGGGGGENVKPGKNTIFLKNYQNSKIAKMAQGNLENSLDLG